MPASVILFDVDGTLVDTVDLHAASWREALHRWGVDHPHDAVRAHLGKGSDQMLPALLPPERVRQEGAAIAEWRKQLFLHDYLPRARPFAKVRELFRRLRDDGKTLAVASSAEKDELERYVELAGIGDLIDHATCSGDADRSKPFPDIFLAALHALSCTDPDQAVVVGDTPWDAMAARKAGLRTVGVLSGGFSRRSLRDAGCVEIHWDAAELLNGFEKSVLGQR